MSGSVRRRPAGTPSGGEFAANDHDEASMTLEEWSESPEVKEREAAIEAERERVKTISSEAADYAFPDGGYGATNAALMVRKSPDQPDVVRVAAIEEAAMSVNSGNPEVAQGYLRLAGWASSKMDAGTGKNTNLESVGDEISARASEIRENAQREAIRREGGMAEARERAREFVEDVRDEVSDFRVSEFDPSKVSAEDDTRPSWAKRLFGGRK